MQELLKIHIVAPVCKQGGLWMKFGEWEKEEVREMVMKGNILGKNRKKSLTSFANTPRLYLDGLKEFMGLYQEELLATNPDTLVEGRLHLWQFFVFKQEKFRALPKSIAHLLEKVRSPNIRTYMFSGFRQLVDSLFVFLATSEAEKLFMTRTRKQTDLTQDEMRAEVREEMTKEQNYLTATRTLLGKGKPYGTFKASRALASSSREKFREDFEGYVVPDASTAIPKYMADKATRDLYVEMVELACNKIVVKPYKMVQISREFVKRLHLKNGHRIQVFGEFKRAHYLDADLKGPARFPYQEPGKEDDAVNIYKDDQNRRFRVINPHTVNMEGATKEQLEEWDLVQGIAAQIDKHKTGANYPCFLWFSQFDQVSTHTFFVSKALLRTYDL